MIGAAASDRPLASVEQWRDALVRTLAVATPEHEAAASIVAAEDGGAIVMLSRVQELVAIVEWPHTRLDAYNEMRERLRPTLAGLPPKVLTHVVLVGGGDEAWRLCMELRPPAWRWPRRFAFHAVDLNGDLRSTGRCPRELTHGVAEVAGRMRRGESIPFLTPDEIHAGKVAHQRVSQAEQSTGAELGKRGSPATIGLIAVILAMYAFEYYLGDVRGLNAAWASDGKPGALMLQMGALWKPAIEDGQWWRLVSCMFLHGGIVHVATNAWSLWALGVFVEKVLGTSRYVILYTVSGIMGSVASALHDHLSVGASGAIFGLLGGLMALTYMRRVMPESLAARLRRSMWPVLVLNIAISLTPGIDASAHLGGAVSGFALAGSGLLTLKMPSLFARPVGPPRRSWIAGTIAALCIALMIASVALALLTGRPWEGPQ